MSREIKTVKDVKFSTKQKKILGSAGKLKLYMPIRLTGKRDLYKLASLKGKDE